MSRSAPLLARRRVEPTWLSHPVYVETLGPEVADVCAAADFPPDPEQELMLDLTFAMGPDAKSAAFEIDVIGPRQNFKTGFLKQCEIGWLYVTEEPLIVHSAHELSTTEEAFNDLRALIEQTPILAKHLDPRIGDRETPGILAGNGRWSINVLGSDGRRLRVKYKARRKTGGRGLTGNKMVLDEGFALEPSHIGSLYPTLAAVPDPQVVTASSAGLLTSAILRDKRDRGRAGLSPRQFYIEYGDQDPGGCRDQSCDHAKDHKGCALDDEKRWKRIQPALGRRVMLQTIRDFRQSMPPMEFAREFMVWWEDPAGGDGGAISFEDWQALADTKARLKKSSAVTLAVSVAPDKSWSTIGTCGASRVPGRELLMVSSRRGMSWVVPEVKRLVDKHQPVAVVLNKATRAGGLLADLEAEGIEVVTPSGPWVRAACVAFQQGVTDKRFISLGQTELDQAVRLAQLRDVGDSEDWDARNGADPSPLQAVTLAAASYRENVGEDYEIMESIG